MAETFPTGANQDPAQQLGGAMLPPIPPIDAGPASTHESPANDPRVLSELQDLGAFLNSTDNPMRGIDYTNNSTQADLRADGEVFTANPDLRLAAKAAVLGTWRDERSVTHYYGTKVRPLLEQDDPAISQGLRVLDNFVNGYGGGLMSTGGNPDALMAHRQAMGGRGPAEQTIRTLNTLPLDDAAKRRFTIALQGIAAGIIPRSGRQSRMDDLIKTVVG